MTRMKLGRWQLPVYMGMALLAAGIFTACGPKASAPPPSAPQLAAPPEPGPGCPRDREPKTPAEWNACIDGLKFDSEPEFSDSQPLAVIGTSQGQRCPGDPRKTCRYGPLAKIEPLIDAQNYSETDLQEGRIIAKLSIPSTETEGYKKFGLKPGQDTYWWVQTDASRTKGTSLFITRTKDKKIESQPVRHKLVRYLYNKGEELRRAMAQWIWTLEDETSKGTCGAGSCTR